MFACLFAVVVFSCFVNCIFFFFVTICCCCCRFCFVFAFLFCFVLLFCLVLLCQGWPRLLACIASWPSPYTIVVLKVYRKKKKKKAKIYDKANIRTENSAPNSLYIVWGSLRLAPISHTSACAKGCGHARLGPGVDPHIPISGFISLIELESCVLISGRSASLLPSILS